MVYMYTHRMSFVFSSELVFGDNMHREKLRGLKKDQEEREQAKKQRENRRNEGFDFGEMDSVESWTSALSCRRCNAPSKYVHTFTVRQECIVSDISNNALQP